MKIVFRVDSSIIIGVGHVMRCLTLADELRNKNADVIFILRESQDNLNDLILDKGYKVYELTSNTINETHQNNDVDINSHSKWLGVLWQEDAKQTKEILISLKPDLLIVDHYALDYQWEDKIKPYCNHIMVIDDLADRKHYCDLLLDQTTGRIEKNYLSLVPPGSTLLLGTDYALLRPEFFHWRKYSLQRRENPVLEKILITFGGVDADNLTGDVLKILNTCNFQCKIEITVVMGGESPHMDEVKRIVSVMKHETNIIINVGNMAEVMANSDLCIGSAGTTSWEKCCLGLPSLMITVAYNQENIAKNLQKKNAAILIESPIQKNLLDTINKIDSTTMKLLSDISAEIVDGMGVKRVVENIIVL